MNSIARHERLTMPKQAPAQPALVTAKRRRRERDQRYHTILTVAERLFCDQGYAKTRILEVATAAEVAVGTVYLYFRNKEDLLLRLLDKISFEFRAFLGEGFRRGRTPMERFQNAGRGLSRDFWRQNRSHVIILFRESVGVSQEVQARRRAIIERINEDTEAAVLDIMREYGGEDKFVAETISLAIEGIFERVAYRYLIWDDRPEEIEPVIAKVMDFIGGGVMSILRNLGEPETEKSTSEK
jgi:AcrR family transcriptional regulator